MLCRNVGLVVEEPKISMSNLKRRIVFNLTSCSIKTTLFARANKEYRDKSKRKKYIYMVGRATRKRTRSQGQGQRGSCGKGRALGARFSEYVKFA